MNIDHPIHRGQVLTKMADQEKWYLPYVRKNGIRARQYFTAWVCDQCAKPTFTSLTRSKSTQHSFCSHACKVQFLCGSNHPNWGGGFIAHGGHKMVKRSGKKYVAEHRIVAESAYGVDAVLGKMVHHIDCDKLNNTPDNLIPLTKSEHSSAHQSVNGIIPGLIKAGVVWFDRVAKKYRSVHGEINIKEQTENAILRNWRRNRALAGKPFKKGGQPRRSELLAIIKSNGIQLPEYSR